MALLEFSKTYKPFLYPWAVELTKKHEEIHWIEDEAEPVSYTHLRAHET